MVKGEGGNGNYHHCAGIYTKMQSAPQINIQNVAGRETGRVKEGRETNVRQASGTERQQTTTTAGVLS